MAFASWNTDYETGNSLIDSQHQNLFKLLNELAEAVEIGANSKVLQERFDRLTEDVASHFKTEEKLMGETGCSFYFSHRASHSEFTRKIDKISKKFQVDSSSLNLATCEEIKDLTIEHICEQDLPMMKELSALLNQ